MKRLNSMTKVIIMLLSTQGCILYSTGETEVGVRTKKTCLIRGKRG